MERRSRSRSVRKPVVSALKLDDGVPQFIIHEIVN